VTDILFYVFASLALAGALGVVVGRNPVASLLSMVVCLGSIAVIYVLLEAHFLAAVQVIVYAGAIMVLFLFVIMLLNLGHDYQPDLKLGLWTLLAFALTGGLFGFLSRELTGGAPMTATAGTAVDALVAEQGVIGAIARPLYTDWVVPFEITGILLLVAIVGALVLAKRRV
jgi:NADH-quinone oxidoreductase subunit J